MLAAMRWLGAKNATAEPMALLSASANGGTAAAAEASPRALTPAAAVPPALATSPSGAKVRQVRAQN